MSQTDKAKHFHALHRRDDPLVLYNIWDAAGAKTIAKAGAPAVATGSWSVAAAHGFDDGQAIPLDLVLTIVSRICASVDLPVSVDFEGGYAIAPKDVAENVRRVIRAGAIGINFEDRVVNGTGLHPISEQAERIAAIRTMANEEGVPIFINARTDLFLGTDPGIHEGQISEALEREAAYADAGASGFFVPGLTDLGLLSKITTAASLPVNAMMLGDLASVDDCKGCNVSRFSFGPAPFARAMLDLQTRFSKISGSGSH
ncbi:carboxyvinyl-carboxyphosphonate phosphorylmutase [Tateyamaria omphalii]|uniref:isocitrate lyase/PEP mutase family protein n=1 Tax=Tateyamaria omphalii TaxID=299262 RepID=UPI0016789E7C|nr:isocitrate lyase/phosphoenolpyruvate mutase family protein [Tateyamaria omphalii]GGX50004.1 carboxyvinyl-carboxyphosphonate phosphorylmutase [Tateyamaria omphalii]